MDLLMASHRAGRIFGIEVHLAYSLYLIMGLFVLQSLRGGWQPVLALLLLPVFVLLHELGHSLASKKLGVNVHRITLYILGGAAEIYGLIPGPKAEIIIAAMGPVVSFALSVFFFILLVIMPPQIHLFLSYCFWANIMLGLFNLLPIFPMDGGRIALAIAVIKCGFERGIRYVRPISLVGVALLAAYGLYELLVIQDQGGIIIILIAVWLYYKGGQELQARQYAANYAYQNDLWSRTTSSSNNEPEWLKKVYNQSGNPENEAKMNFFSQWSLARKRKREEKQLKMQQELNSNVDSILQKVKDEGISSLTPQEKELLKKASQNYRNQ